MSPSAAVADEETKISEFKATLHPKGPWKLVAVSEPTSGQK